MKFASAISTKSDWTDLLADLTGQLKAQLGGEKTDLALLFVHPEFLPQLDSLATALWQASGARHLVGCTGASVIGADREVEDKPAVSLLVGALPGVQVTPFHVAETNLEEATGPAFWHFFLDVEPDANPIFLIFVDPFTTHALPLVEMLSDAFPNAPLIGGLASGGHQPGENRLILDHEVFTDGAVGLALTGRVAMHTVVSQGCKPIGRPFTVTRADKNIVFELGGQPPLQVLQEMLPTLSARDQKLARTTLFLGRVINEYQEDYGRGDFLIRNLLGSDPQSGALAIGDWMRTGQTVQFQVRDKQTADEDLRHLMAEQVKQLAAHPPQAAVLFSCLGRGEGMYGVANHDINVLHEFFGPIPTAGFFCNGEIGPIGDRTFVHGFTSVIGLFSDPSP